jgi:hypothetical protein
MRAPPSSFKPAVTYVAAERDSHRAVFAEAKGGTYARRGGVLFFSATEAAISIRQEPAETERTSV